MRNPERVYIGFKDNLLVRYSIVSVNPGQGLLSSYVATGIENVPIFIKADNAEKEIEKHLNQTAK